MEKLHSAFDTLIQFNSWRIPESLSLFSNPAKKLLESSSFMGINIIPEINSNSLLKFAD